MDFSSLYAHNTKSQSGSLTAIYGLDKEMHLKHDEEYSVINIYAQRGAQSLLPGKAIHGGMLFSDAEVMRSDYYQCFLKPTDLFYIGGGMVSASDCEVSFFSVHRSRRLGQYTAQELKLFGLLLPHLQKALRIHQHLHTAKSSSEALVPSPRLVLLGERSVLVVNQYARNILAQQWFAFPQVLARSFHNHPSKKAPVILNAVKDLLS